MNAARIEGGEIGNRGIGTDLTVDAVACFEADVFALADFENRRDVGMVAVVAGLRFGGERLGAVDADGVHGRILEAEDTGARAYTAVRSRFNRRHSDASLRDLIRLDPAIHAALRNARRIRMGPRLKSGGDDERVHPVFTAA